MEHLTPSGGPRLEPLDEYMAALITIKSYSNEKTKTDLN
jgi:hypothetical protein